MGKKLSHIDTFHRLTKYAHQGPGHSVKQIPGYYARDWNSKVEPGVHMKCVCGHSSATYDANLIDDPGACTTCGNVLKRFEMFTTSYERCYRCEPIVTSQSTPILKSTKPETINGWTLLPKVNDANRWVNDSFSAIKVVDSDEEETVYPLTRKLTNIGFDWVAQLTSGEFNYSKTSIFDEMVAVLNELWLNR